MSTSLLVTLADLDGCLSPASSLSRSVTEVESIPFVRRERGCVATYTRTPLIAGEIENNNGRKKHAGGGRGKKEYARPPYFLIYGTLAAVICRFHELPFPRLIRDPSNPYFLFLVLPVAPVRVVFFFTYVPAPGARSL